MIDFSLYAWGSIDDKGRCCLNFDCPQALHSIKSGHKKIIVPRVYMRDFPMSMLPDVVMPDGCTINDIDVNSLTEASNASVYFGVQRFFDNYGYFPLQVKFVTPLTTWWEEPIGNIIWSGVKLSLIKGNELEAFENGKEGAE